MADDNIANLVRGSLQSFQKLVSITSTSGDVCYQVPLVSMREEEARFKIWSGNIGAHNSGRRSLQYRLRDASHLQKQIIVLLEDLIQLLEDAMAIVIGDKIPWDQLEDDASLDGEALPVDVDADDGELSTTEMTQISAGVSDVVNCLLRLSVAIRNPAPHDRFATFVPVEASHYEPFDIEHVRSKFGMIESFLAERLGKAISRRRQYFRYRQSHHLKLSHGLDVVEQKDCESTIASSIPGHAKAARFNLTSMDEDAASDSGVTQTSFASSSADTEKISIPPLPEEAENGPFECPFCYMMIIATSTSSWKRHVFADLRPYVCLSENCTAAEREFTRRHEWTLHEMQNHWKVYNCPISCGKSFQSMSRCRDHITKVHPDAYPTNQIDAMISLSTKSMTFEDEIFCPICRETLCSMKEYQRHVGRHQEQLALFALPSISSPEDGENVEDNSVLSQSDVASEYMVKDDGKSSSHHADLIKELGNLKVEIEELGHLKDEIEECRRRRALEDGHTDDEARRLARHERERVELALQEKIQRDLYEPYNDKSLIGDGTPMPDGLDLDVDGISRAQDHSHKSTPQDFSDSHSHAPIAVPDNPSQDSAPIPIGADNSPSIASEIAQLEMQFRTKNPNLSLEQAHLLATEHMTRATLAQRQPAVNAAADILYGQREAEIFKTIEEKSKVAERQKKVEETLHLGTEATIEVQGGNSGKETKRAKPEAEEEVLEERIASEKGASALTAAIEKARREFGAEAAVAVHKKQDTARIRGQQKAEAAREMTESDTDEKLSVIYKDLRPESHKEEQSNTRKSSNPEPVPGGVVGVVVSEERARAMHRVVPSYGFQSIADTNNALNWTREPNQPATMPSSDATPGIQPTMPYSRPQTPPQEPVALISGEASSSESGSQDLSTREKILNSLLKKYPRRIRPKTEDEMARRLEELGSGLEDPDKEVGFKEEPESMSESFNRNTASDLSKHQVQGLVSSQTREPTGRETLRGVLKQPTSHFPENPNPIREGVSRLKDDIKATQISAGAKYTKISKKFVSQEALTIGKERFEVQDDFNIVLRPLTHEEIQAYASATQVLRERTARGL